MLLEAVFSELDFGFLEVSIKCAIKIGNRHLLILLFAHRTGVFLVRLTLRILPLYENITRSCIDVETVRYSLNSHVYRKEIPHRVNAMGLGASREMQRMMLVTKMQISHVVINNVTGLVRLLQAGSQVLRFRPVVNRKSLSLVGLGGEEQQD